MESLRIVLFENQLNIPSFSLLREVMVTTHKKKKKKAKGVVD